MDLPRPVKIFIYALTFLILVLGFASKMSWFSFIVLGLLLYSVYRFVSMSCYHRYLAIPMAVILLFVAVFNIINLQTMSLLGIAMVFDIFL